MRGMIRKPVVKDIQLNDAVRESMIAGSKIVHDAVGATMGPGGQYAIFPGGTTVAPKITKDGVSVASQIYVKDPHINQGVQMVIQACRKQVEDTGDGTTLTAILTHKLLTNGLKLIKSGENPRNLLRDMYDFSEVEIIPFIESVTRKCDDLETLQHIATVSTNGDESMGGLIAKAVHATGIYGYVGYGVHHKLENELTFYDGIKLDTGAKREEFWNCQEGLKLDECDNPFVFCTDIDMQFPEELFPALDAAIKLNQDNKTTRPLIIFANDVRNYALSILLSNIKEKRMPMLVAWIRPGEGIGPMEREYNLRDIAALTGARFFSEEAGDKIDSIKPSDLGQCRTLYSNPHVTLISGVNDNPLCQERKDKLTAARNIREAKDLEKTLIEKSFARLNGGMGQIKIGGQNESERSERFDRCDDAIKAARCALKTGVIEGGGVTLIKYQEIFSRPQQAGAGILYDALSYPTEKILSNYQHPKTQFIIEALKSQKGGYTITDGFTPDKSMWDHNIIDPAGVVIDAIRNSVSVASQMLQTAVSIIDS
jgi:chaperonin GroEL